MQGFCNGCYFQHLSRWRGDARSVRGITGGGEDHHVFDGKGGKSFQGQETILREDRRENTGGYLKVTDERSAASARVYLNSSLLILLIFLSFLLSSLRCKVS